MESSYFQSPEFEADVPPWIRRHIDANKSLQALAARAYRKGGSWKTVKGYVQDVVMLCAYVGGTSIEKVSGPGGREDERMVLLRQPDELLADKSTNWVKVLNGWLDDLVLKKDAAPASAQRHIWGVRRWLEVNDVDFDAEKVELPKLQGRESHAIPDRKELRKAMETANLPQKVLAVVGASSGLRIGSLLSLKLKDVDLERETPMITPPAKSAKGKVHFFTFCTPEAKRFLEIYFEERRMNGEKLTPDSPLIVNMKSRGMHVKTGSGAQRWLNTLRKAELDQKAEGGSWHLRHFHVLRKFFRTWTSASGTNEDWREFFMGHRSSISQRYFGGDVAQMPPDVLAFAEREYAKAVPALTIYDDETKIAQLESTVEKQARALEAKEESWEAKFEALKQLVLEAEAARKAELQKTT